MSEALKGTVSQERATFRLLSKYRGALMGIQILLIVFFHFTDDCRSFDVRFDGFIEWFWTYVHSSGVDVFLLLSGLGLYFSWKRRPEAGQFYRKRLVRLLVPYFVIAIPAWIAWYMLNDKTSPLAFLVDLFFVSFFTSGQRWMWYILMATICYLIFPLVYDVVEGARDRGGELVRVLCLCMGSTMLLLLLKLYHGELYSDISIAISRFPAFFIGVLVGKYAFEERPLNAAHVILGVIVAALVAGPLGFADKSIMGVYSVAVLNYAVCLLLSVVFWKLSELGSFLSHLSGLLVRALSWLGRYTLEIYVLHVVFRRFFILAGFNTYRYSAELALFALSLVVAVIVERVCAPLQHRLLQWGECRFS